MAMNLGYVKRLVGILKILSIVLLIISFSLGLHAFLNSEYNKKCMDNIEQPQTQGTSLVTSTTAKTTVKTSSTISISTAVPTTGQTQSPTTARSNFSSTTENTIVSLDPQPNEKVDKIPILWMERWLIIVTGSSIILSTALLILHLVRKDFLKNPKFQGFDFGYHFFAAILLIASTLFMAYSANKIDSMAEELCTAEPEECQLMKEKMFAATFSFLSAVLFLAICIKGYGKKFYQKV